MGLPPFGFAPPFANNPANLMPFTLLDIQTLPANANIFPRDFAFPAVPDLFFAARVPGYGGTDVIAFQFNGDTGNNYWDNTDSTPAVSASGTTAPAVAKTATVTTNMIRLGLPINKWRIVWGQIINDANREKGLAAMVSIGSAAAPGTTNTQHLAVSGGWDGAAPSQQISRVTVRTAGALNMLGGTKVWFYTM